MRGYCAACLRPWRSYKEETVIKRRAETSNRQGEADPARNCVPTAALSPGEAQPSAGMGGKGHCSLVPLSSPSETLCSVAFMLAERFPEERLGCAKTKHAALGWR